MDWRRRLRAVPRTLAGLFVLVAGLLAIVAMAWGSLFLVDPGAHRIYFANSDR